MSKLQSWLIKLEEYLAITLLVLMSLATFTNVLARYLFSSPIAWAEEFSRYTFIWLVFISAVVATAQNRQIVIDTVVAVLPQRVRTICQALADMVVLILMAIMIYYGWVMASAATEPAATLGIPQFWVYLAVPVSATLILYHTLTDFLVALHRMRVGGKAA